MFPAVQLALLALGAASCPSNLANDLATPAPAASRQLITVEAATSRATYAAARAWARVDGCWTKAGGPYVARVGRNGVRTNKREADGATPASTFPIGGTMYGNSPSPGVSYPYVRLRCGDWWVEDSRSPAYNTFQRVDCGRKPPFKVTTPDMSTSPRAYAHLAVIEYNMHPVVPGRGSGIFLHVRIGKATSGCVSLPRPALVRVLRWLRRDALPQIAIGTTGSLRQARRS
jgi:L,D-peptidoglycan transpeptidase YkuD (ErfK/YbiS/YcfS/YnhG family)